MAAREFPLVTLGGTSSNYLNAAIANVTAAPLSFTAWILVRDPSPNQTVVSLSKGSGGGGLHQAFILELNVNLPNASTYSGSGVSSTSGAVTAGVWTHVAAVYTSATSRLAYTNGVAGTADTNSRTPTGINYTTIGAYSKYDGTVDTPYGSGYICEVGIWNTNLTADQVLALAQGARVNSVAAANLKGYFLPVYEDGQATDAIDVAGFGNLTLTGTLSVEDVGPGPLMPRPYSRTRPAPYKPGLAR